jgi:hypothetical protein
MILLSLLFITESKNMKTNFKLKIFLIASIFLVELFTVPLFFAKANSGISLYMTPSSGSYNVGDFINVSVKINTNQETINSVKANLTFSENLKVQNISKSGSILELWIEDPSFDNSSRIISFGGAGAGTTYKGSNGQIISINFKIEGTGEGIINFSSSSVKYGATTITVDSSVGATYTLSISCDCTSWQNKSCGENNCFSNQRFQKRTCIPSNCDLESRCIDDSNCVSQPSSMDIEKEVPEKSNILIKKKVPQESLLASLAVVWGGFNQLVLMIAIVILGVVILFFIGIKEWGLLKNRNK